MTVPVYCINLQERTDRKELSQIQFHKLNLFNNVIYPIFYKDVRGGVYGCYNSHVNIWIDFFTNYPTKEYCFIFEDDFIIHPNTQETIRKASRFMRKKHNDIDILHLHSWCIRQENKHNNTSFSSGYGVSNVSYCITRSYIQSLVQKGFSFEPNGKHIDIEISLNINSILFSDRVFYTNHTCITQSCSNSDNYLNIFDKMLNVDRNVLMESAIKYGDLLRIIGLNHSVVKKLLYKFICIYIS